MQLKPGTLLQGGKYKIVRFIKSGGFGCTYEAWNTVFEERVAIKEFFPKDFCNREDATLHVTVGTHSKKPLVDKMRNKFIDEAKAIRKLSHSVIVKVSDVFEENGTAYYVMDYIDGCSLDEIVRRDGALPEQTALGYIRQVCSALDYVHSKSRLHLDIKPGNIMVDRSGHAILIDFGTSKQYDEVNGENTSTLLGMTPGYAPLEQNKHGGVSKFTPATDIYSVGATVYKLLTGLTPPDADEVNENGLPPLPSSVSASTRVAVETAMSPKRKDRPQSVEDFLELLDTPVVTVSDEETMVVDSSPEESDGSSSGNSETSESSSGSKANGLSRGMRWLWGLAVGLVAVVVLFFTIKWGPDTPDNNEISYRDGILRVKGVEYPMVYVSGGSFDMGAITGVVTLSSYSIGKYEVTQDLWEAVMGSNPSYFKGERRPVEGVSWDDCQDFIRKLNELAGASFRFPTEAEWEFAARGGNISCGYQYSGSDNMDDVAWYDDNSGNESHNVGAKSSNELGIYDMSGNVYEWCNDRFEDFPSSSQSNLDDMYGDSERVLRGGSWVSSEVSCRNFIRSYAPDDHLYNYVGLRLCH